MTLPAYYAARELCERDEHITNLRLQKVLYMAHMACLGIEGVPLVDGHFQAWNLGPVHPAIYRKARIFGNKPVNKKIFSALPEDKSKYSSALKYIDDVVDALKNLTSSQLVGITHDTDGAWYKHYQAGAKGRIIPNHDIEIEYNERFKQ